MNYSLLEQYDVDKERARAYGFVEKDGKLCLQKAIADTEFYAVVTIADKLVAVDVFDSDTNEEYLPFNVADNMSGYVMHVREKVDALLDNIKKECLIKGNIKLKLMDYVPA